MKVFLYYIGKPKDPHANAIAAEYIKRANRYAPLHMSEIRPDRTDLWTQTSRGAKKIFLDPLGRSLDSAAFADLFAKAEMQGHDLVFWWVATTVSCRRGASGPICWFRFPRMTMPHELARAVLAEQIYRAFTILRGHPYPR